ncbi:MAG: ABC transporter ATP-binding protein [Bdellovibrionia bacterium]
MSTPIFQVKDLRFDYSLGGQNVPALRGVSLSIDKKELVCLTGPSGSGKTTLLNVLGLIEPIQKGDIVFAGKSYQGISESEKNKIRRYQIGFIFQSFQLFPVLTAEENVEYFLARQGLAKDERKNRVEEALRAVGLWEKHRNKKPLEMSGGQRQRVAVARAIAKKPEVIIADEPTASLDQKTGRELMELFTELNRNIGATFIVSSHDPMVREFLPRQIHLLDGQLTDEFTAEKSAKAHALMTETAETVT